MIRDGKTSQVVYRTPDEKANNPERLNLDRWIIGFFTVLIFIPLRVVG